MPNPGAIKTATPRSASTSSAAPGAAPLRQLTANAGVDGSIVIQDVRNGKAAYGYNVATGQYVDMLKAGIIDPTKVTRGALQNAASIAGLLLVTEAMVADLPKKAPPPSLSPSRPYGAREGIAPLPREGGGVCW